MRNPKWTKLPAAFVLYCFLPTAHAQIVPQSLLAEALSDLPAQTEALEYDNLAALRSLPNYEALKQRFSGKPLQRLKAALSQIDVPESAVAEIVMVTTPAGIYGLIAGSFNGSQITANAVTKGCSFIDVEDSKILSPTKEVSVLFLSNTVAAYGTPTEIKSMLASHRGAAARFGSNAGLVHLLNQTDRRAPVRGISSGSQMASSLAEAVHGETSLDVDWSRLAANIAAFSYAVKVDNKAHVAATLQCQSPATAALLRQTLSALSALQSVATFTTASSSAPPFENLEVSSSGLFISLKMDTPLLGS